MTLVCDDLFKVVCRSFCTNVVLKTPCGHKCYCLIVTDFEILPQDLEGFSSFHCLCSYCLSGSGNWKAFLCFPATNTRSSSLMALKFPAWSQKMFEIALSFSVSVSLSLSLSLSLCILHYVFLVSLACLIIINLKLES
jgi:hypothetical protein